MADAAVAALSPETVLAEMKKNGVTHVVWLPDSETNWLYLLMKAEPSLRLVGVSREGHACSIAAGLSVSGAKPLILIQNTGMMASGINYYLVENDADAPRISIAFEKAERTRRPVVVLVGDEYHGFNR